MAIGDAGAGTDTDDCDDGGDGDYGGDDYDGGSDDGGGAAAGDSVHDGPTAPWWLLVLLASRSQSQHQYLLLVRTTCLTELHSPQPAVAEPLGQWLSTFLLLRTFTTVPHVVVTRAMKLFLLLCHNCDFASVMNCNVNI